MNYVDWYRQQQQNLMNQGIYKTPGGLIGRPIYIDTPTSAERIGGEIVNIGAKELGKEIKRRAGEALAQKGVEAGAQSIGQSAAEQAIASGVYPEALVGQAITQSGTQAATQGAAQVGAQQAGQSAGSTLGTTVGVVGALKGAYDLSRVINKRQGATAGAISGMTTGASLGSIIPGVGTLVGAGVGLLAGTIAGKLFSPRQKNYEKERWERLKMYGFDVPKPEWVDTKDAALKAENKNLAKDFVGYDESGKWVNNQFANTGKDEALRPQDIYEFATNHETFGEAYGNLPEQEKLRLMQIALDNKLVKEHQGTVDINWTPETLSQATDILAANEAKMPGANRKVYVPDFGASFKPNF
jgi:hypothetical protein